MHGRRDAKRSGKNEVVRKEISGTYSKPKKKKMLKRHALLPKRLRKRRNGKSRLIIQ
jgi:hypothetical protein